MTKRFGVIPLIAFVVFTFTSTGHGEDNKNVKGKPESAKSVLAARSSHGTLQKELLFSVQVAACLVKRYAYETMAELRAKGYEAYVFKASGSNKKTWYAVRIGDYEDLEKASQAASEFERQEKMPAVITHVDSLSVVAAKYTTPEASKGTREKEGKKREAAEAFKVLADEGKQEAEESEFVGQGTEESGASIFEQAVTGKSTQEGEDMTGRLGRTKFDLNGYVRAGLWLGRTVDEDDAEAKSSYGEAALKLRVRKGDKGDGYAEIRLREGVEVGEEESSLDVREAYINVYAGPFDIRFGRQIIVWGRADTINPTNNLTPYDWRVRSPDEDDRRLANLGVRTYYNFAPFRLEGVWMPTYAESHFPDVSLPSSTQLDVLSCPYSDSFDFLEPFCDRFNFPDITIPVSIKMAEPDYPETDLSGGLGAIRLHYETPAWDASVSYLQGYATFPGIEFREMTLGPGLIPQITMGLKAYEYRVIGFDFATTFMEYGLRGEMAYRHPYDYEGKEHVPMPDLQYVLGIDREFAKGDVMVIAQYVGRYVCDWQNINDYSSNTDQISLDLSPDQWDEFISNNTKFDFLGDLLSIPLPEQLIQDLLREIERNNRIIQGQQHRITHSGFVRVEWKLWQETLSLEVANMYNFTTKELFVRPMASYDIADSLNLTIGGEIYHGPDDTLFGTIDESQSAGFVEMKVSF